MLRIKEIIYRALVVVVVVVVVVAAAAAVAAANTAIVINRQIIKLHFILNNITLKHSGFFYNPELRGLHT